VEQIEHDTLVLYGLKHQSVGECIENHVRNNVLSVDIRVHVYMCPIQYTTP